jgi:DNA invertase Pin-like site-specific DNA recombinase
MNDFVIAKYLRLSQDDAISESMSIPHQRELLNEYIEGLEIPNATVIEFVDNGYSGTNLNRPDVQEMLDLVRSGRVSCIVVKDFSRFSRDSMESGYYIEQVFPLFGVRFISVADNFDSADYEGSTGGIDVAFKFLMHEYYSKDLSMKIKSSKHIQMKRGENIVGRAIYGYRKNNEGKWEHDPPASDTVKMIFDMALDGKSTAQIRDKLFADRHLPPREYEYLNMGKDIEPTFLWATHRIHLILSNEQYTGTYIAGKRESTRIPTRTTILKDKSEWTILPDSHPAIVSKDDFERVQIILNTSRTARRKNEAQNDLSSAIYKKIASGESKPRGILYGYRKNAVGDWIVDEDAAVVVKIIYDYALQGSTARDIAQHLQDMGHLTPSEQIKRTKGIKIQPTEIWSEFRVREILLEEQYTGVHYAGKSYQGENGKRQYRPKSEWIAVANRHPAIITKEDYEKVQETFFKSRKKREV